MSRIVTSLFLTAWLISAADFSVHGQTPQRDNSSRTDQFGDPLPPDALARFGTIRLRHGGEIAALAFSPDDKVLASAGADGAIRLWDIATGTLRIEIKEPWANCLAFSPDGKTLASGTGIGSIRLRDATTGEEKCRCAEHQAKINALVFSSKGLLLASASADKSARIWDVASGKEVQKLIGHEHEVCEVVFAAGDTVVATKSLDNTLRLWETTKGKELHKIPNAPHGLAASPDGEMLATSVKPNEVELLDPTTGKRKRPFDHHIPGHTISPLAFSVDGRRLIALGESGFYQLKLESGEMVPHRSPSLGAYPVLAPTVSRDGDLLAWGKNGCIKLFNLQTGKELFSDGEECQVTHIAISSDGRSLASVGNTLRGWDYQSGKPRFAIERPGGTAFLSFDSHSKNLILADDGSVAFLDGVTGSEARVVETTDRLGDPIGADAISPNGRIAAGRTATTVAIWDVSQQRVLREISFVREAQVPRPLSFSPDGAILAIPEIRWSDPPGWKIGFWDVATANKISHIIGPSEIAVSAFSPDGKRFVTGNCEGLISLWDVVSGKEVRRFSGHRDKTLCLSFSGDGRTLLSGGQDGIVRLWEIVSSKELRDYQGHRGPVTSVAFLPDGRGFVSGSADTTVLSWNMISIDIQPGKPPHELTRAKAKWSEGNLDEFWNKLASENGRVSFESLWMLVAAPSQAVPFLETRLKSLVGIDHARIARLIADLDADQFALRERATEELERLGQLAEPALHKALEKPKSLEVRRRIQHLLEKNKDRPFTWPQEVMRALRAIDVLEKIGTPEARALLAKLADGAPEENLKQEAKRSLERLAKRP
jgi:WD40 repeat protein